MEPEFLEFEDVLALHERSLREHGGSAGMRDEGLIRSAVGQPQNDFYYGGADLFGIAAAYAFHIAQAQAFIDGNKRTGLAAADQQDEDGVQEERENIARRCLETHVCKRVIG